MPPVAQLRTSAYTSVAGPRGGCSDGGAPAHIQLLMQLMLERIAAARGTMASGDETESERLLHAAVQIAGELRARLDVRGGGPFVAHLDDQYDYLSRRLVVAAGDEQVAGLDGVADLLREMQCAWVAMSHEAGFTCVRPALG
ncbi:MAG TPA: flagellar export chaperone FliS [Steroidobacteraceae bacterium]